MKKAIIVIFIFLSHTTFSQTNDTIVNRKNTLLVSYSPFPLIVKQYTVNFEYIFSEQFSISLDLGKANALYDSYSIIPIFIYNSYITRTSLLFIPSSKKNFHWFFGPGLIYRQLWNDKVVYNPNNHGDCFEDANYQKRKGYSLGVQITQGWRWFYGPFTITPFYRGGIVSRRVNINTYSVKYFCEGGIEYYSTNRNRKSYYPSIEVELGVRFGLNYRFKKR